MVATFVPVSAKIRVASSRETANPLGNLYSAVTLTTGSCLNSPETLLSAAFNTQYTTPNASDIERRYSAGAMFPAGAVTYKFPTPDAPS